MSQFINYYALTKKDNCINFILVCYIKIKYDDDKHDVNSNKFVAEL